MSAACFQHPPIFLFLPDTGCNLDSGGEDCFRQCIYDEDDAAKGACKCDQSISSSCKYRYLLCDEEDTYSGSNGRLVKFLASQVAVLGAGLEV